MSITATLPVFLLNNPLLLNEWIRAGLWRDMQVDTLWAEETCRLWAYVHYTRRDNSRPQHVFDNRWDALTRNGLPSLADMLQTLAEEYLYGVNGHIYVRDDADLFGRWQNLRTRMSLLPVRVAAQERYHATAEPGELLHPYSPAMLDFTDREGLNETHLHHSGYMFPDECWLDDLYHISEFTGKEAESFKERSMSPLRSLYAQIDARLDPYHLNARMRLARHLRNSVLCLLETSGKQGKELVEDTSQVLRSFSANPRYYRPDVLWYPVAAEFDARVEQEEGMWRRALRAMADKHPYSSALQHFLHIYLLLQNEHIALNAQSTDNKGFRAFQTISDHERVSVGSERYNQSVARKIARSTHPNRETCIELRFSPKNALRRTEDMLRARRGLPNKERFRLICVAHFIKKPTKRRKNALFSERFATRRQEYREQAADLAKAADFLARKKQIPMGIDAASSELDVPPEVFAPAYRLFERRCHVSYKTYHCGEDFQHLISGMRAIEEAVTFLGLENGSRIGHGTAIGILPEQWLAHMPAKLLLPRGEHLLNLLFVLRTLPQSDDRGAWENEALRLGRLIFPGETPDLSQLQEVYDTRHFIPDYVRRRRTPCSRDMEEEYRLIDEYTEEHGVGWMKLHELWHFDGASGQKQDELTEVDSRWISPQDMLRLQQCVQRLLVQKNIAIECPPVSNLRISQYSQIREHHILRWLQVGDHRREGDAALSICLGSDDPGIFVTDLENEYYHLFYLLRDLGLTPTEAIDKLRELNNNGRIYAFRRCAEQGEA